MEEEKKYSYQSTHSNILGMLGEWFISRKFAFVNTNVLNVILNEEL